MKPLTSQFWFTAGAPDCQDLLKHEVLTRHPQLRLAFSRPGLVTFKSEKPLTLDAQPLSQLAMMSGLSLGGAKTIEELVQLVRSRLEVPREEARESVVSRNLSLSALPWPTEEDEECTSAAQLGAVEEEVGRRLKDSLAPERPEFELCVLVPPPARPEFGYFAFARPLGARPVVERIVPPSEAPSRAYSKLVEALAHFRVLFRADETALELGAAPGGATYALLERGLSVLAVDPADMDARLALARERGLTLRHLKKPAQALDSSDLAELPSPIRWLVSDMNVAPPVSAAHVLRARALVKKDLRGAVLTLKLNDTAAVDTLPRVLAELARAFGRPPEVAHLPSHRREVVVVFAPAPD